MTALLSNYRSGGSEPSTILNDLDYYLLSLRAGETVRVFVDSVLTDPLLSIDYRHSPDSTVDDDSGGGLFGVNPELFFRAEAERVYRIVIDDPSGAVGGYTLSIERQNGRDQRD